MSDWKTRPSGLIVPAFPDPRPPMSSLPVGWPSPKPDNRVFTRPGSRPADPAGGSWSIRDLHIHAQGRADATAELLIGVAVLKCTGSIWNYYVDSTGAVWQDWEGSSGLSHRAHRMPCNPIITNSSIPDFAPTVSLRNALIDPLARTDFLPLYANHADSRFEKLGGAASLASAVRVVVREQPRDKPVDYDLFRHAALAVAQAGYKAAYEQVNHEVLEAMNDETAAELFERTANYRPKAPKDNLESVQDAADDLLRFTASAVPNLVQRTAFQSHVDRLTRLASGNDSYVRRI